METDLELEDARKPTQHRPKGRGNGEGAIYKRLEKRRRGDGTSFELERWCSAVTLLDGSRKVLYGRTRDEVAKKLTRALKDLQVGVEPPDQRVTVGPWLTRFIDDLEARGAAHSTVVRYRGVLRNYLAPRLGKIKLAALQPQQFQSYQSDLLKRGFAASTITIHRALLGSALKEAVTFGLIQRNIVALVKPPRENREATGRMLTPQEARRLLQVVADDRLEAFYLVLLTAGLRRGEALGLRWVDLDLDGASGPELNVRQQLRGRMAGQPLYPSSRVKVLVQFRFRRLRSKRYVVAASCRPPSTHLWAMTIGEQKDLSSMRTTGLRSIATQLPSNFTTGSKMLGSVIFALTIFATPTALC